MTDPDYTADILAAVERAKTRNGVVGAYAQAISGPSDTDWPRVNEAIIRRWSRSGLAWIKKQAWRVGGSPSVSALPRRDGR